LLERAIHSVLRQTLQDFELIVVLDGPEPHDASVTADVVASFRDPRIRLLTLGEPAGGGAARNAGVAAARADWIAFLDDDDEFVDDKLELQRNAALACADPDCVLLTSQVRVVGGTSKPVWPLRFPAKEELLVDYLFCRHGLRQGEAFLQSSTFFVSRELALHAPFRADLARHQDWDWVIALQVRHDVRIVALPCALTLYHRGDGPSVSRMSGWRNSRRTRAVVDPIAVLRLSRVRRALRIFPLYYLCLLLIFLSTPLLHLHWHLYHLCYPLYC
jgi:glycosyltransferase involved in cell wall biosynthesis